MILFQFRHFNYRIIQLLAIQVYCLKLPKGAEYKNLILCQIDTRSVLYLHENVAINEGMKWLLLHALLPAVQPACTLFLFKNVLMLNLLLRQFEIQIGVI